MKKLFIMRLNKYKTILCTICNPMNRHISGQEIQLQDFIKSIYNEKIIYNNRKIIYPHSHMFKNIDYHKNKTEKCKEKNINLVHIWENEWTKNKEEIKSNIIK